MSPHLQGAALFISDLHLHPSRPQTARLFEAFLGGPAKEARILYILGDLFDAWAGDDDIADGFNAGICAALKSLAAVTPIAFLPGNRDFLAGSGFAAASGATLLADETVVDIAGTPTLLLHGDTLCTDDLEYQAFRATVRSGQWQRDFLAHPLAARKAEIESLRERSERKKCVKPAALMDTNAAAVSDAFRRHNVARVIHGHTHRRACHEIQIDGHPGTRWVLGDWHADGNALACDASGCRWLAFPAQ